MNRRDGKKLVCLLTVSILATAFSLASVAFSQGDWLPNPSKSSDSAGNVDPADSLAFDSGFRPDRDGFAFENYGNEYGSVGLTGVEMQRLFGSRVCSGDADCTLLPNARRWMEENNKAMMGGHCEGMAVLSLLFFLGIQDPEKFGASIAHDLKIEANDPLQREIAYWWATQCTDPAENVSVDGPAKVLKALIDTFSDGENAPNSWTAGVAKEDGSDSHAVTPFAIRDKGGDLYEILVYDNNYPDETRGINVDIDADTFSYDTSSDPEEESSEYSGHNLNLTGTNDRLVQQKCDFCQDDGGDDGTSEQTSSLAGVRHAQVWQDGGANMLIKDDQGRRLGRLKDGSVVNEIPGSKVHWFLKSKSPEERMLQRNNSSDYLLQLPYGINYTVSLEPKILEKSKAQDVTSIGPGYYTEVRGLAIRNESDGRDLVEFHSRKNGYLAVSYRSAADKTPLLRGGTNSRNGTSYEFIVAKNCTKNAKKMHDAPDERTSLGIDRNLGRLLVGSKAKIDSRTTGEGRYDLMVARLSKKGPEIFSHKNISLFPGAVMSADYSGWQGEGYAMTISVDENDDGVEDETINLADEGGSYEDVIQKDDETADEVGEGVDLARDSETGNNDNAGEANSGSEATGDGANGGIDSNSGFGGESDGE